MKTTILKSSNKMNKLKISAAMLIIATMVSGCGEKTPEVTTPEAKKPAIVKSQSIKDSRILKQELSFPALVMAGQEARIIAKTSGTVKNANFKLVTK
jgi:multidrug efflux pump subunit AcrA (membrane-fusion protein)